VEFSRVRISAKTEYACLAVIDLAMNFDRDEPLRVREISERHGIPAQFLVQILLQLKAAGFVVSTRGAAGGYRLTCPPAEISLAAVMSVVEPADDEPRGKATRQTVESELLRSTWQEVCDVEREMLERITFANLAEQSRVHGENMFYI